jgi:hypothetical protein
MSWTMHQFGVVPVKQIQDWVQDGRRMLQFSEAHFKDHFLHVSNLSLLDDHFSLD